MYRPLGEEVEEKKAVLQVIATATKGKNDTFADLQGHMPMCIELPSLDAWTLKERYQMITSFFLQESMRLKTNILLHRDVLLAFLLYSTPGNLAQLKRDITFICVKGFLQYQKNNQEFIAIHRKDLPITIQKDLAKDSNLEQKVQTLLHQKWHQLYFNQKERSIHWQTKELSEVDSPEISALEKEAQVEVPAKTQNLANRICDEASMKLNRVYSKKDRFTLALHLQAAIERVQSGKKIPNQKLNEIRKHYLVEFQTALELASMIEREYHLFLPMEEIGYHFYYIYHYKKRKKRFVIT